MIRNQQVGRSLQVVLIEPDGEDGAVLNEWYNRLHGHERAVRAWFS